jgi:hypothetical protein
MLLDLIGDGILPQTQEMMDDLNVEWYQQLHLVSQLLLQEATVEQHQAALRDSLIYALESESFMKLPVYARATHASSVFAYMQLIEFFGEMNKIRCEDINYLIDECMQKEAKRKLARIKKAKKEEPEATW